MIKRLQTVIPYKNVDNDIVPKKNIVIEFDNAIKYIGQSGTSGYATAAKGYIADYILKGVPISWQPLIFDNSKNDRNYYVDALAESVINKEYNKYESVIIHSTPDLWDRFIDENKEIPKKIGYCTWETDKLPNNWINSINKMDEVWVPSEFNRLIYKRSGVETTIKVVPHIKHQYIQLQTSAITLYDYYGNVIPKDKFTFYSIGELNFRKGIEDLITIFDKLRVKYKNIQLVLKLHYKEYSEKDKLYCLDTINKLTNRLCTSIFVILDNLNYQEMIALHTFGNCYVSLNKGEGFGLTIFDAFNMGKDIICTNYSGYLDYLGIDYKGLCNYKLGNIKAMSSFSKNYTEDQQWAYPDLNHAYSLMENLIKG